MPTTKIDKFTIAYTDAEELRGLKQEIFTNHSYYVELPAIEPRMLDIGAHIGLASLYFKKLYPAAEITAIEPHPIAAQLFRENLWQGGFDDVELLEAAVAASSETTMQFYEDSERRWLSTTGPHRAWNRSMNTTPLPHPVQTIALPSLLAEPIDLMKMDIEGMEYDVLLGTPIDSLKHIRRAIIEYHPSQSRPLEPILDHLQKAGMNTTIFVDGKEMSVQQLAAKPRLSLIHASQESPLKERE